MPDKSTDQIDEDLQEVLSGNFSLRRQLQHVEGENEKLRHELTALRRHVEERESLEIELQQRLAELRGEADQLTAQYMGQFMELDSRHSSVVNLYVASHRLNGVLDRASVLEAIQEIVVNQVGSEEFGVYEYSPEIGVQLACSVGVKNRQEAVARVTDLWPRIESDALTAPDSGLVACVPLRVDGRIVGAIVIHSLLPHKAELEPLDYELFELLSHQAGTALHFTSLHEKMLLKVPA